jgi:hypothetical protein
LRRKCPLKHITEGNIEATIEVGEYVEEDVSNYWVILSEDTGN